MQNKPVIVKQRRRMDSAEAFIDLRVALGRVAFALADLTKESGLSAC
jgi:hypothetical protein